MAVRGEFSLNERPATQSLRNIEREGARADVTMRKLGQSVDDTFNAKNLAEAKSYQEELDRTQTKARELDVSLDNLSRKRVTPQIDLDGIAAAITQVEILESRLNALDRQIIRPNVVPGGAPGGGSFGRVPTGGGGGGGLRIPFAGAIPLPLVGAALAAAPPLIGGAGALLGSAGAATLGLGALGITGGGVGATAGALSAPTSIVAIKGMKEASKALADYQKQVLETGPNSKKAKEDLRAYNAALSGAPEGTGRFLHARTQLGQEFGRATRPGQAAVAGIGTRGINLGRQLTPTIAPLSNRFLQEAQSQTGNFADFLNDPQSRDFYRAMANEATADLSNVEGISENVLRTMENIARAGRPFFHEGMEFLERWTKGWKTSTNDLSGTRKEIGGFVDDLKAWGKLTGATFDLGGDLLGAGRKPGTSMVSDLTSQLKEWDRWVERNPREVRAFFRDAVDSTEKIAGGVSRIAGLLWKTGQALSPLIDQSAKLLELLDSAGLLTAGGLPFLIAGGAGIRNTMGTARGRILGGGGAAGGAGVPLILGGAAAPSRFPSARGFGARVGATSYVPTTAATRAGGLTMGMEAEAGALGARRFSAGRALGGLGRESGALLAPRGAAFARGFGARIGPLMALSIGLGALTTEGGLTERLQGGLSQGTFGLLPPPPSIEQRYARGFQDTQSTFAGNLARKRRAGHHVFRGAHGELFRNMIPAAAAEAGMSPGAFRYRQSHPLPLNYAVERLRAADTGTPQGQGEAAFLREQIGKIKGGQARRAGGFIEDIRGAARVEMNHDVPGVRRAALGNIADRFAGIHDPRTAKLFGNQGLDLAHQIARENPKLKGVVDQMASSIEKRFADMGEKVQVIHGRIVDVSASSWDKVAKAAESKTAQALAASSKNLSAMEHQALSILRNMGFSPGVARQLAQQSFKGGEAGALARAAGSAGTATAEVNGHLDPHFDPGHKTKQHGATGMRLGGSGLHDTVNLGGGNMAAPGELLIGNRHTERKIDRLLAPFGTTLAREIGREGRAHSEPFRHFSATGSITPASRLAQQMGLSVSGGPGFGGIPSSGHASGSLHYSGLAYDVSGAAGAMLRYRKAAEQRFLGHGLNELFYDPYPYYIDQGHKVPGQIGDHSDHVHVGFFPGGAKGMGGLARGRAAGHPQVHLQGLKSGVGGLTGLIGDHANQMVAAGASSNLNRLIGRRGGGGPGMSGGGSPQKNMALARQMMGNYGWGGGEWADLKSLWQQESGWSQTARNPSSGAYGIPQSLPASKMGAAAQGAGPAAARAQIAWGLKYIQERYGSPSGAWAHEQSHNWYSLGGRARQPGFGGWFGRGGHFRVKNPTMIGVGESGEETVRITPKGRGGRGGGIPPIQVSIGAVHVRSAAEATQIGRKLGQGIAAELAVALKNSDGVSEDEA